jgi:hypothetical protein
MRYPGWLSRMRARFRNEAIRRDIESRRTTDPLERELVEQDIDAYKADVFTEAGDGSVSPTLAPADPSELYEELEHDEERPRDPAR